MLKCVAADDDKPFSYQEWQGPHIVKLTYKKHVFFNADRLQWTKIMPRQMEKIESFKGVGYEMINGYEIHGKEFSDPNDNSSGVPLKETNVIIMARHDERGAIAILPNGEVHSLSSKSWKPVVAHFKV